MHECVRCTVAGSVLCDLPSPVQTATRFVARIVIFNINFPITKGFPVSTVSAHGPSLCLVSNHIILFAVAPSSVGQGHHNIHVCLCLVIFSINLNPIMKGFRMSTAAVDFVHPSVHLSVCLWDRSTDRWIDGDAVQ